MPVVIDAYYIVDNFEKKLRLPTEAFFVDTNIVKDYEDPFSVPEENSEKDAGPTLMRENITKLSLYLKSLYPCYSVYPIALEYFSYIQKFSYRIFTKKNEFDSNDFKKLRGTDEKFRDYYSMQLEKFKRTFKKHFKLFPFSFDKESQEKLILDFNGLISEFCDYTLYDIVIKLENKYRCIFSNDSDFYSFKGDFYLLTFNKDVIREARKNKEIY